MSAPFIPAPVPVAAGFPIFQNFTKANCQNTLAIMDGGLSGAARGRIALLGDSALAGFYATANQWVGTQVADITANLTKILVKYGYTANNNWMVPDHYSITAGSNISTLLASDTRLTVSGANLLTGYPSLGGNMLQLPTGSVTATFTPGGTFDTAYCIWANNTSQSSFTLSINGGSTAAATIPDNASVGVGGGQYSVTAGSTALTVKGSATTPSYIIGLGTATSTAPAIEIINAAAGGRTLMEMAAPASTGATYNWCVAASLPLLLPSGIPSLTILNGWYNDMAAGRTIAQAQADLLTCINNAKLQGDVWYITYGNLNPATTSAATQATWNAAMTATALAAGIPVIRFDLSMPAYATELALGYVGDSGGQGLHFKQPGQAHAASLIAQALLGVRTLLN